MKGAIFNFSLRILTINNRLNCRLVWFRLLTISYNSLEKRSQIAAQNQYLQLKAEFHGEVLLKHPCRVAQR